METTMWRLMIDDEIGFLVKTATAEQAKAIVSQRFQVNANEIKSVKPDSPAPEQDKPAFKRPAPDIEKAFNLDKDRFSKPKPSFDKPGFPTLNKNDEDEWKKKQSQEKRW